MKRLLLSLFIAVLSFHQVSAQIGEYRSEFAIGGGAGIVLSNVGFMPEVPQKMHEGRIGGLSFRYTSEKYFNSICAVVAEVNYAQIGWKEDIMTRDDAPVINSVTGQPEQFERMLNYIQVPVLARLGWGRERRGFQAFFQLGPQFGYYLNSKTTTNFNLATRNATDRTSKIIAQDSMSVQRPFDYGITAGLGLEFSHPKVGHFLLEGRYYYGLGDIYNNSKRDYFGRSNFSNIVVKLSYLFDIKKTNNPKIK